MNYIQEDFYMTQNTNMCIFIFGIKCSLDMNLWDINKMTIEQGKSEGFDSCDLPSNLKLD